MRKQVEGIQGRGKLTFDGAKVLQASYGITVYQKYVVSDGCGKSYDPSSFQIVGTVIPEDVTGFAVQCRRGEDFERLRYATHPTVELSPLPCWKDLSKDLQKKRIAEIAQEIEEETKARLEEQGVPPLGPDAIRRQSPETIPPRSKKSPAPLFLAASKRIRDDLRNAYYAFVTAFREAADQLRERNRDALFPEGSFPPAMPFVGG